MKKSKIRIGILFGGRSAEHEISLLSARNIVDALDKEKYEITLIGIDKQGQWRLCDEADYLLHRDDPRKVQMHGMRDQVSLVPLQNRSYLVSLSEKEKMKSLDVIFPILHGTYGEDGSIQGLLKLTDIPFIGASVLGSAVGMDKEIMKRLLRDAGIPIAKFRCIHRRDLDKLDFDEIVRELGLPLFIKPSNLGSSVGVSKVKDQTEWHEALAYAFEYDHKILVEEAICGREIECAVLGNEHPIASLPGEVFTEDVFYSYESKYFEGGVYFEIPPKGPEALIKKIQEAAIAAYQTLYCEGLARVDMFLDDQERIIINEINTLPGFTKTSAYPQLWKESGLELPELLDRLVELAIQRTRRENVLKTHFRVLEEV
jgi:D-alanine-D-alanine ligase